MIATVTGYAVGEVKTVGDKGMIAVRVKERFYDSKQRTSVNRFVSVLVHDKNGRLFEMFRERPNKMVTATGSLQMRVYNGEVDSSIFVDGFEGFKFGDCVDREELQRQGRQDNTPSPAESSFAGEPDGIPF